MNNECVRFLLVYCFEFNHAQASFSLPLFQHELLFDIQMELTFFMRREQLIYNV